MRGRQKENTQFLVSRRQLGEKEIEQLKLEMRNMRQQYPFVEATQQRVLQKEYAWRAWRINSIGANDIASDDIIADSEYTQAIGID